MNLVISQKTTNIKTKTTKQKSPLHYGALFIARDEGVILYVTPFPANYFAIFTGVVSL
jgi:hypothetical protein